MDLAFRPHYWALARGAEGLFHHFWKQKTPNKTLDADSLDQHCPTVLPSQSALPDTRGPQERNQPLTGLDQCADEREFTLASVEGGAGGAEVGRQGASP